MRNLLVVSAIAALFAAAGSAALAGPHDLSIASLIDGKCPLDRSPCLTARLASLAQDDGWGWGEAEPPKPDKTPESNSPEKTPKDPGKSGKWGDDWTEGENWTEEGPQPGGGEEETVKLPEGPKVNWARKTKIGLDFGGFLPFGEKDESFSSGQIASLFLGFGLADLGGITVSNQIKLVEGSTSSIDQANGYDVSTFLIMIRDELHFHFIPNSKSFDFFAFVGLAVAFESSSGTRVNPANGQTETSSGFYYGMLADAGIGASFNLFGPVDALLRLEFNFLPVTQNVQFFLVGQIGIQIRV